MKPALLGRDDARHLLRRLACAATPAAEAAIAGRPVDAALATLIDAAAHAAAPAPPAFAQGLWTNTALRLRGVSDDEQAARRTTQAESAQQDIERLRHWWLDEMVRGSAPLREHLVLFFHSVFGSNSRTVDIPHAVYGCNALVRRLCLGTIPDLLESLVLDPAMMIQIGMDEHRRERISDRPAKLILDHWTVGAGEYSPDDVEELSKALTGWVLEAPADRAPSGPIDPDAERAARRTGLVPRFVEEEFDARTKTILGATRNFDARSAIRHLASQPATARRFARLLLQHTGVDDPQQRAEQRIATAYLTQQGSMPAMLAALVQSDELWSEASRWALVKSPVHLAAGACRQLQIAAPPFETLSRWLTAVGQTLFDTPNSGEGGWPGQDDWVTPPDRLAVRYTLPAVLTGRRPRLGVRSTDAPAPPPRDALVGAALQGMPSSDLFARLDPAPGLDPAALPGDALIHHVMASLQYQLA